jgi:HSP20 family protein
MFFAATQSPLQSSLRRQAFAQTGRAAERFLDEALFTARQQAYTQDDTTFSLTLDMPGIAKEQLSISIEGAVVRISSKEGAARKYRAAYELPQEVDTTASAAKLENGVLTLTLVKKVPVSNAAELPIN